MNVLSIGALKANGTKIVATTCYDVLSARVLEQSDVDIVLVGDSVAMVVHGFPSTLSATLEMMEMHTAAVSRGLKTKFLVADMPFPTFREGLEHTMDCVDRLMKAGANAVKLEGIEGHEDIIAHIVQSGIPVMGHLGLIPQSVNSLGGYRVQARDEDAADVLLDQANRLERAGCFAIVLECVSREAAARVTQALTIPTIGIGAGPDVDGQVLVLHDLTGMNPEFHAKFSRAFGDSAGVLTDAVAKFVAAVRDGTFPTDDESFG